MASVIKAGNATDGVQVTSDNTGILELKTGTGSGTTAVTVDTSQNVGLGVTPSAWGSTYRVLEGSFGQSWFYSNVATITGLVSNTYNNGTNWIYKTTNAAARYQLGTNSGDHQWYVAVGGTAGNAISFTQAMTLDASANLLLNTTTNSNSAKMKIETGAGNRTGKFFDLTATGGENWIIDSTNTTGSTDVLGIYALGATGWYLQDTGNVGIGTTSPGALLHVAYNANTTGWQYISNPNTGSSTRASLNLYTNSGGGDLRIEANNSANTTDVGASGVKIWNHANAVLSFGTNALERMRIDSSGNVGIGTSSPGARLQVNAATDTLKTYGSSYNQQIFDTVTGGFSQAIWQVNGVSTGLVGANSSSMFINTAGNSTVPIIFSTGSGTTERARIDASGFTQFSSNLVMPYQGAPTSKSTTATLTGAELITGILNTTGTSYTVTLPTGTNIEGALTWSANNVSLDWYVINTASGTITIGANGNTTLGSLTIATGTSAHFRIRRTAANTFTVYRL